jgi:hypothetical protein
MDIPGKVTIEFPTQEACEQARATVQSSIKFKSFKVTTQCVKS